MSLRRLPQETSEAIIDLLHDDRDSLSACSLTCKDWTPRSRSHIFSDISLYHNHIQARSLSIFRFLSVVQSWTQPGRYVRSLSLGFIIYGRGGLVFPTPTDHVWTQEGLPILAENLPNVCKLELSYMVWDAFDAAGRTAILSGFRAVRDFTLYDGCFSTITEMAQLISSFPALESLAFMGEYDVTDLDEPPAHLKPPSSLHKVQIEGFIASRLMGWFTSGEYPCGISDLEVIVTDDNEFVDAFNFLRALGPTLKHLHLALLFDEQRESCNKSPLHVDSDPITVLDPWPINLGAIDLTQNTSLVSLQLRRVYPSEEISAVYFQYIPRLISHICSSQLESLIIDPRIKDGALDALAWGDIDYTLLQPRFSRLRDLTFLTRRSDVDVEILRNHVRQKMPGLATREPDIMHFCRVEEIGDSVTCTGSTSESTSGSTSGSTGSTVFSL